MPRYLIIPVLCVVFHFTQLHGQSDEIDRAIFSLGLTGGLNLVSAYGTEPDNQFDVLDFTSVRKISGSAKFSLGLDVGWIETQRGGIFFTIETGGAFVGKGYRVILPEEYGMSWRGKRPRIGNVDLYQDMSVNYFEVPLLIKPTFSSDWNIQNVYLILGAAYGFVISAIDDYYQKISTPGSSRQSVKEHLSVDLKEDRVFLDAEGGVLQYSFDDFYREQDISIILGAGLEMIYDDLIGLFVEAKYSFGLLNFNNISEAAQSQLSTFGAGNAKAFPFQVNESKKFRYFQCAVGIKIHL